MNRLRSLSALALLVGAVLAACGKGSSAPKDGPSSDQEILALKPVGTNAVIVHAIGYGSGVITISDPSQTCITYEWGESAIHYSQVCWAFVPIATSSVTLTATAGNHSQFTGWSAPCDGSMDGICAIPMDRDRILQVGFWPRPPEPKTEYVLSVHVLGFVDGDISAPPEVGLSCQAFDDSEDVASVRYARMCRATVPSTIPPTQVTLTATSSVAGTQFAGWGGNCSGTGTCTVTMDRDVGVTAGFVRGTPSAGTGGGGTPSSAAADCGDLAETGILQNWSYVFAPGNFTTTLSTPTSPSPYRGQSFIRAVTTAAYDFGLVYTAPAVIDARGYEQLRFAVRALNPNLGWQGSYPVVYLEDSSGSRQMYAPNTNLMPRDGTTWVPVTVPFGGGAGWTVTGTVDLSAITRIEIHSDTWEWNELTIDVDGLSFEHPTTTCTSGRADVALYWDGASWDGSNWQ